MTRAGKSPALAKPAKKAGSHSLQKKAKEKKTKSKIKARHATKPV
jgi:hypothetical protein